MLWSRNRTVETFTIPARATLGLCGNAPVGFAIPAKLSVMRRLSLLHIATPIQPIVPGFQRRGLRYVTPRE